jgi:hypothetical protein
MKKGSLPAVLVLWLVLIVGVMKAGEPPSAAAGPFQTLTCGLEYRHDVCKEGPLSIHVLRIHRSRRDWSLHTGLGQGTVYGLEPLDGIVARTAKSIARPVMAAINGDFFVIEPGPYQGDPRGLQIVNRELVSRPAGSSLWVAASGELKIGRVASKLRVVWPDGKTVTPLGLNEARADDAAVLYTPTLGIRPGETPSDPPGTRTKGGRELVLERVEGKALLPIQVGNTYAARVREVHNQGDTPLAPNQMILSLGPKIAPMPQGQPGDVLQLVSETEPDLRGVQTALGAGRILVQDGKLPNLGPADQPRHPRSLIGWNQQYLLFVVVDGRQPKLSIGMTYPEMAALAQQYGCTDAVEMDGGGSSTLWAMGKILNSPSDGKPRAIANGLILIRSLGVEPPTFDITTKKPADQVKVKVEKDTATFDVSSPSGIGVEPQRKHQAAVFDRRRRKAGAWNGDRGLRCGRKTHHGTARQRRLLRDQTAQGPVGKSVEELDVGLD